MKQVILDKLKAAFSKNSLLHGLFTAVAIAVLKVVYPVVNAFLDNMPYVLPTWQSIVKVAIGAAVAYVFKNFIMGSSNPILQAVTQPVNAEK